MKSNMKTIFTVEQVAKICKVTTRTVSKWFDSGRLRGYRIPGDQDRRIPREHLIRFLKEHGMPPLGELEDNEDGNPDNFTTQGNEQMSTVIEPKGNRFEITFDVSDKAIREMRDEYLPLAVTDFSDTAMVKAVIDGHKTVKKVKASIESRRKELNADALAWQRTVNATAKSLTEPVQEIEDHLKAERDKIDAEKARVKEEKERAEQALLQGRVSQLAKVNGDVSDLEYLRKMSDDMFAMKLRDATEAHQKAEAERIETERLAVLERQRLEEERLAEEQKRLESERQQAEQLKLQQAEIEKQRAELEAMRRQQAERDQLEAERMAAVAEKQRLAEQVEKNRLAMESAKQAEAERLARAEEMKPIKEQLQKLSEAVENIEIPKALDEYRNDIESILESAADQIREVVS